MIFRHCHKSGHDMESCFQLVGYPDWGPKSDAPSFATAGRGRLIGTGNQGRGRGQHLQERGGGVVQAFRTASGTQQHDNWAHATAIAGKEERGETFGPFSSQPIPGFTNDQWNSLMAAIKNQTSINSDKLSGMENS